MEGGTVLSVIFVVLVVLLAVLPFTRSKEKENDAGKYRGTTGLKAQFITIFLFVVTCFFVFFTMMCFRLLYTDFRNSTIEAAKLSVLWMRVIISAAVASTIFIIILSAILKVMQKKVVEPLCMTSDYAAAFADGRVLKESRLCLPRTDNELDSLGQSVDSMVSDIRSYVEDIRVRTAKEEHMAAQLSVARTIQMGMLPDKWEGTGFGLVPYIKPAKEVGGDFYYFSQKDENSIFVCIADVSGKDVSAAMFMARTKTLIEAYAEASLGKMMEGINQALAKGNNAMMFVTAFAAVIDKAKQTVTYVNAGHNAPVYYDQGVVSWLADEADLVLGIRTGIEYQEHVLKITDSFRLFIYTDGINEAQDVAGRFFGDDRILQMVEESIAEGCTDAELINNIDRAVHKFTQGAEQSDDITMMAVSVKGREEVLCLKEKDI